MPGRAATAGARVLWASDAPTQYGRPGRARWRARAQAAAWKSASGVWRSSTARTKRSRRRSPPLFSCAVQPGAVERAAQHGDGLVVRLERHREGWPSLPPCAKEKRAGSEKRAGAPCTTSATSASDCRVRGPRFSSSSRDAKSRSRARRRPPAPRPAASNPRPRRARRGARGIASRAHLGEGGIGRLTGDREQRVLRRLRLRRPPGS